MSQAESQKRKHVPGGRCALSLLAPAVARNGFHRRHWPEHTIMCSELARRYISRTRAELPTALILSIASPTCTPRADQLLFIELSLADFLAVNGNVWRSFDADADLLVPGRDNGDDNPVADENSPPRGECHDTTTPLFRIWAIEANHSGRPLFAWRWLPDFPIIREIVRIAPFPGVGKPGR